MPFKDPAAQRAYSAAYRRKWRAANLERARANDRKYRAANLDKCKAQQRKWYSKNAVKEREKDRIRLRSALPTPTRPEPHTCEICGLTPQQSERRKSYSATTLCLDHCHATHRFRGWICRACNLMLGYARDNPKILRRAITYLELL